MIVVADASPLNYLVLIGEIELLAALYQKVPIPQEVLGELQRTGTPPAVHTWASSLPEWCQVGSPTSTPDSGLSELDAGERDAIQLALDAAFETNLCNGILEARRFLDGTLELHLR